MSVYRLHSSGVWSNTAHLDKLRTQLNMIPAYDVLTDKVFSSEFSLLADRLNHEIMLSTVGDRVGKSAVSLFKGIPRFVDFVPPVCVFVLRGIVPPLLKRFFHRLIQRG